MFKFIESRFNLYLFGRFLKKYGARGILRRIPVTAFHTGNDALPDPRSLAVAAENAGLPYQSLLTFLSVFDDLCARSAAETHFFPTQKTDEKSFRRILKTLYELFPERENDWIVFERLFKTNTDFRLESAALERFRDHFSEDGALIVAQPDWAAVGKDFFKTFPLATRPLDFPKRGKALAGTIVKMIVRDGFYIYPSPAVFQETLDGKICLTRSQNAVEIKPRDLSFLTLFLKKIRAKDYAHAAKALLDGGFFPPDRSLTDLACLIETSDRETTALSIGEKADCFIKRLEAEEISLPFSFKFAAKTITAVEILTGDRNVFNTAADDFNEALSSAHPLPQDDYAQRLKNAFSLTASQSERLEYQNKKAAFFQQDLTKIQDILLRHEEGYAYRRRDKRFPWRSIFLTLAVVGAGIAYLIMN